MTFPFKKIHYYFYTALILLVLSIYFYWETIFFFPSHVHAWTQSDRLALVLGFLDNNFNFLKPQTFNLSTTNGITGVDFPIHEYLVALIMKMTGSESPVIFRLYSLIYSMVGYLFLFRLTKEITDSFWKSAAAVIFVFTCPIITYYQAGFIPSATSLSSAFIGYYYYFIFIKHSRTNDFYLAISFITLAALARTPFNIFLFAIFLQQLYLFMRERKIYWNRLLSFAFVFGIIAGYNVFKAYLNTTYGTQYLTHILPAENLAELIQIITTVILQWAFQLFSIFHYLLLFAALVSLAIYLRKRKKLTTIDKQVLVQGVLIITGAIIYFLLMARQFIDHDYYFMDSFYLGIILLFILGIHHISASSRKSRRIWMMVFGVMLFAGTIASKRVQKLRYTETMWDRGEITRKNFAGSANYLDSLGISRSAVILVIDAYSTNAPLILMDRKGYTVLTTSYENIKKSLEFDFDFIVIQDIFLPSDVICNYPGLLNRLERIGGNGKISIFKLRRHGLRSNVEELLGIVHPFRVITENFDTTKSSSDWKNINKVTSQVSRSSPNSAYVNHQVEYGPTLEIPYDNPDVNRLLFEGYFYLDESIDNVKIACSITQNGKTHYYWDFPLTLNNENNKWIKYQCLFTLPNQLPAGSTLKCYLWNPNSEHVYFDDYKITLYRK